MLDTYGLGILTSPDGPIGRDCKSRPCVLERSAPESNPYSYVRCARCDARGDSAAQRLADETYARRAEAKHHSKGDPCWLCGEGRDSERHFLR